MKIKVVAFDCDGVMFDTAAVNRQYYNRLLALVGKAPMTDAQFEFVHMHTVTASLAHLFGDGEALAAAIIRRKEISYFSLIRYMEMEPTLRRLLTSLQGRCALAVATNRSDTMEQVLVDHDLAAFFDLVVTAMDVENPKPHPDQLLKIMRHFDAAASEVLFIGDSQLDAEAAAGAGVEFAAYNNTALQADHHLASLAEIGEIVAGRLVS